MKITNNNRTALYLLRGGVYFILTTNSIFYFAECEDEDSRCYGWSTVGECQKNKKFMHVKCKASCGLCDGMKVLNR